MFFEKVINAKYSTIHERFVQISLSNGFGLENSLYISPLKDIIDRYLTSLIVGSYCTKFLLIFMIHLAQLVA